jgi:hypothetical protein
MLSPCWVILFLFSDVWCLLTFRDIFHEDPRVQRHINVQNTYSQYKDVSVHILQIHIDNISSKPNQHFFWLKILNVNRRRLGLFIVGHIFWFKILNANFYQLVSKRRTRVKKNPGGSPVKSSNVYTYVCLKFRLADLAHGYISKNIILKGQHIHNWDGIVTW